MSGPFFNPTDAFYPRAQHFPDIADATAQPFVTPETGAFVYSKAGELYRRNLVGEIALSGAAAPFPLVYNVMAYGAVGDGVTDDTAAIQATIAAMAAGDTLYFPPGYTFKSTTAHTIAKAMTVVAYGATLTQATANTGLWSVTASGVRFMGGTYTGPQHTTNQTGEKCFVFQGTAGASPTNITDVSVEDATITEWGQYGIYAQYVQRFRFSRNTVRNIYYAGIAGLSAVQGEISENTVDTVVTTVNGYGIFLTRLEVDSLTTDPRSSDVAVTGNVVRNVTNWEGYDTHAGQRITFTGNVAYGCLKGISLNPCPNASSVETFAPLDCVVSGNTVDSGVTAGTSGYGISAAGCAGSGVGTPGELATVTITGNVIRGYGTQSTLASGAIYLRDTSGASVIGNKIVQPSPHGVCLYHDNYGFTVMGNQVEDAWSSTVTVPSVVYVASDYNTGFVGGNADDTNGKSATYLNVNAVRIESYSHNTVTVAPFQTQCTNKITDTGSHSEMTQPAIKQGFYGVSPIARAVLATGASHTVDDVITALQNLGLVKQS